MPQLYICMSALAESCAIPTALQILIQTKRTFILVVIGSVDEKGCQCEISWSFQHFDVDFPYYLLPFPDLLTLWIWKKENQERLFFFLGKKIYLKQSSCEQGLHLYVLQWRSDYYAAELELMYLFWCHNIEIKEHSAVNVRVILNNIKWDIYLKRWGIWLYPVARSWTIM